MKAGMFLAAMALSFVLVNWLIRWFNQRALHQAIREDGPATHLKKRKTPSMGGLAFVGVFALAALGMARGSGAWWVVALALVGAALGAADDWLKVSGRDRRGLKARVKMVVLTVASLLFGLHLLVSGGAVQTLPFGLGEWKMGWLIVPFALLVITGASNAVNLTDGLDGLLGGLMLLSLTTLFALHGFAAEKQSLGWMLPVVAGAVGGFLLLNVHPARIFMGDTGSLFLGVFLAAWCLKQGLAWFLPVLGLVYVAEALSVILQVASFRLFKKRIFRMSPLHHHFEKAGLHETAVVVRFWMVGLMMSVVTLWWA